ncbi:MAG: PrsW family glutamic-type intramembrane protease [Nitrososphaeria archaeon]
MSGMIVSVPLTLFVYTYITSYLQNFLNPFYVAFLSTTVLAPVTEEFAKSYPLFYRQGETERSLFTLGFLASLGFGVSEFCLYVLVYGAPISVKLLGILFHACNTSIVAFDLAKKHPLPFYLVAVLLHFSNNFFAISRTLWLIDGTLVLFVTYLLAWVLYGKTTEKIVS